MKNWTIKDVAKHWDETLDYDEIISKTDSYFRRFTDTVPLITLSVKHATLTPKRCYSACRQFQSNS